LGGDQQVGAAIAEVRLDFLLAKGGLGPALETLASRSSVPVELDVRTAGRLREAAEIAAYYIT
jgi:methylglyoxal synthase